MTERGPRRLLFAGLGALSLGGAAGAQELPVALLDGAGQAIPIGSLSLDGEQFEFDLDESTFDDHFLSMRPFRCIDDGARMVCYLPYPYEKPGTVADGELRSLELDLLFIHRRVADYGIDPWNGLYYKLSATASGWLGSARAVDLNILASPPEDGVLYPIGESDLHPLEGDQLWLPQLRIGGE